ncbi:bublin coiled-coil protein-like [Aphidius gifuensis]|nr:bublin coiled-coil protein-like [Aphidius gifuensis]
MKDMVLNSDENMVVNAVEPCNNVNEDDDNSLESEDDNYDDAEFQSLNAQLDQLNSVLDNLETKNDVIRAELVELLKTNKETRKQIQDSQLTSTPSNDDNKN